MTESELQRHRSEIAEALAHLLRHARFNAALTQADLAERTRVAPITIARWECALHLRSIVDFVIALEQCHSTDKFVSALAIVARHRVPSR